MIFPNGGNIYKTLERPSPKVLKTILTHGRLLYHFLSLFKTQINALRTDTKGTKALFVVTNGSIRTYVSLFCF